MKKILLTTSVLFFNICVSQVQTVNENVLINNFSANNSFLESINKLAEYHNFNPKKPQLYIDGNPIYYKHFNAQSANMLNANKFYPNNSLNLDITGARVTVGIWDEGKVLNSHNELVDKFTYGDSSSNGELSDHATHVSGTVFGKGFRSDARGIAYGSFGRTYDWSNDLNEMNAFASSYNSTNGLGLVSNHSYGFDANSIQTYIFGKYVSISQEADNIMYNNPYYQIVVAAGNDRNDYTIQQVNDYSGYDLLTGMCVSKNTIVVGAIKGSDTFNASNMEITNFSNYGPTDDGRVKPDFVAKGLNVLSSVTNSNSSYSSYPGTSMAAPAISGLIALLQDHHFVTRNSFMKSSRVRAILVNSARDTGTRGPDYNFGWGIPDAEIAANIISDLNSSNYILEDINLNQGAIFSKDFTINGTQNIDVTIAWTDPAFSVSNNDTGVNIRTSVLVNNLDLKIYKLDANGNITNTYYPWKLNPNRVENRATQNNDNDIDNIEKIQIFNATSGSYRIVVNHKGNLTGGSQDFSLVGTFPLGNLSTQTFDKVNLKLYPNPATEQLFIEGADLELLNNATVEIYSIDGKLAKRVNTNGYGRTEINISDLTSGFYSVKLNSKSGSFTTKFIKK